MTIFRALMIVCLLVSPAIAQGNQLSKQEMAEVEAIAQEAKIKFKAKKFKEAARLFLQVYSKTNNPVAFFNAGRCYEEAGQYEEAIMVFKEYLNLKDASDEGRKIAQEKISKLTKELEEQKKQDQRNLEIETMPKPKKEIIPQPIPQGPPQHTTVEVIKPKETPIDIITWGSYGGALVLIGTGTVGMITSAGEAEELNKMNFSANDAGNVYTTKYASIQRNYYIFGATCVVGAGLGAYATWRLLSHKEQTATSWHIVPAFSQSTPMMVLSGNF